MIPMRLATIFRNRWWALIWAAGILWFALDVPGGSDEAAQGNGVIATGGSATDDAAQQVAQAINSM